MDSRYLFEALNLSLSEDISSNFNFTDISSEHKDVCEKNYGLPYEEATKLFNITGSRYFTYAWLDTPQYKALPIAVVDYPAKYLKFKKYQRPWVVSNPVWTWISDERTEEQQEFINNNIKEIDEAFKQYILDKKY